MGKDDYHNVLKVFSFQKEKSILHIPQAHSFAPSYMFLNFQYTVISPP